LASAKEIVQAFQGHLNEDGTQISRAEFEKNLFLKMSDPVFLQDLPPLLAPNQEQFEMAAAHALLVEKVLVLLPGQQWKREEEEAEGRKRSDKREKKG